MWPALVEGSWLLQYVHLQTNATRSNFTYYFLKAIHRFAVSTHFII